MSRNTPDFTAECFAKKYPWFDAPLIEKARNGENVPPRIEILAGVRPGLLNRTVPDPSCTDCSSTANDTKEDFMSIIDEFISGGEHRITAGDDTPDEIEGIVSETTVDDDMLTEELAAIYMAQGLIDEAVEIYKRLSLLNPEKSVYFAEIIDAAYAGHGSAQDPQGRRKNKNN